MRFSLVSVVLIAGLLINFSSCKDDNELTTGSVVLQFKPVYDGQPLAMYAEDLDYTGDIKLQLQLVQFFMTDALLTTAEGESVELLEVDLISFADLTTQEQAEEGITQLIKDVPVGDYSGIQFNVGVNPTLNGTSPADYTVGDPLSSNYWTAAGSYVFYKVEGNADLDGDGMYAHTYTYHIGGDPNLVAQDFQQAILVKGGQETRLVFELDVKELLISADGTALDIVNMPVNHAANSPVATHLRANMSQAITLI